MDRFDPQTEKVNLIPSTPPLPKQLSFSRKPASIDKKPKNKITWAITIGKSNFK